MQKTRGYSLIELTLTMGLGALLILPVATSLAHVVAFQKQTDVSTASVDVRMMVMGHLQNPAAIKNTMDNTTLNPSFTCLDDASTCTGGPIVLLDAAGDPLTDYIHPHPDSGATPTQGLDLNGEPCSGFDETHGNPQCPFQVRLRWEPVCSGSCSSMHVVWKVEILHRPGPSQKSKNSGRLSFDLITNYDSDDAVDSFAVGYRDSCALLQNGRVKCWGSNTSGQLGRGGTSAAEPTADWVVGVGGVGVLTGVTSLVAGFQSYCALLATTEVVCWGSSQSGSLGNGTTGGAPSGTPVYVMASPGVRFSGVDQIYGGYNSHCARKGTEYFCWGLATNFHPDSGAAGDASDPSNWYGYPVSLETLAASSPGVTYPNPADIVGFYTGTFGSCFTLAPDSQLTCWGKGSAGRIPDGNTTQVRLDVKQRIPNAGTPLRPATYDASSAADAVNNLKYVADMSIKSYHHRCVLLNSDPSQGQGRIACWGYDSFDMSPVGAPYHFGLMGRGSIPSTMFEPPPLNTPGTFQTVDYVRNPTNTGSFLNATGLWSGWRLNCAVDSTGDAYCWGGNHNLQVVNDGSIDNVLLPTKINLPEKVTMVIPGEDLHVCALTVTKRVFCWGNNGAGQLGNGSTATANVGVPHEVVGL